ncbi:uncharacterized protein CTRU02_206212 [Colletotrichum truncatum]|uniref:Uncharacterized protein n=1 Tax=Colletotrichum truncatum TaxID=5467 RepID=A0ACC3Z6B5_COLTU|nr:uncharacterized protein CTRU02_10371 [Colletotrichum truncatum]KAF6787108.1 hypothetical protein CTRU02_10371 [Colletotrichum truncatum]
MPAPTPSSEALSLLWRLQGPLEESIFVVQNWDTRNPPREPYATRDSAGNLTWHAISQASLAEPKIKSISIHVDVLERWQREWIEWHERHASPEDDHCIFGELPDDELYKSEGDDEEDEDDDDDSEGELLRCCDTERPKRALPLGIKASNMRYITIHDYISTLHPWLMGLREDIAKADNLLGDRKPEEYENLVVDISNPHCLTVMDDKRFLGTRYTGAPVPIDTSQEYMDWFNKVLVRDRPNWGTPISRP